MRGYMRKIVKSLGVGVAFAAIAGGCALASDNLTLQTCAAIASGISGTAISALYEYIDTQGQGLKMWFKTHFSKRNSDIFLSFSYLYRIEVDGKYLMVAGHRISAQYQPVGGVYKYYDEAKPFLDSIKYIVHTKNGNTDETDDLRISVKGKYLLKFYEWFSGMDNREYDPRREFFEELIEPGYLPEEKFKDFKYRKVSVHNVGLTYSEFHQEDEWIHADIFELKLSGEQKELIRQAVANYPEKLCLVSPDEIKRRAQVGSDRTNLGTNAPWILE